MADHLLAGKLAESLALQHLQGRNMKLVASNWQGPRGEIDLIMTESDTLVFIEVRFRKTSAWGHPAETISAAKRRKIITTAQLFLQKNKQWLQSPCRFDVISITGELAKQPTIEWSANVFLIN